MEKGSLRGSRKRPPAAATSDRFTSGMPKRASFERDHEVAGQHDLGATRQGRSVDGGDDRLRALSLDDAGEPTALGLQPGGIA